MTLSGAISRLQSLALQSSTDLSNAPDYPPDAPATLPFCVAYLKSGTGSAGDDSYTKLLYAIGVDFHVSRQWIQSAHKQLGVFVQAFHNRLAGDPTLAGNVDTIDWTNSPAPFSVRFAQYNKTPTIAAMFDIVVKIMDTPLAST
jgi:hypothetical protein